MNETDLLKLNTLLNARIERRERQQHHRKFGEEFMKISLERTRLQVARVVEGGHLFQRAGDYLACSKYKSSQSKLQAIGLITVHRNQSANLTLTARNLHGNQHGLQRERNLLSCQEGLHAR